MMTALLLLGCSQRPATPAPTDDRPLSADEMQSRVLEAMRADRPSARLDDLRVAHHALATRAILSPLQHHRCWAVRAGEDPLTGYPDMDYACVSDRGDLHYPYTSADFSTMLAREDTAGWGGPEHQLAAQLYVHLQSPIYQDAGWVVLASASDFMAIDFNMASAPVAEREAVSRRIQPPQYSDHTVEMFTWTVIGGAVEQWRVAFSPGSVTASATDLGRFGGGGYD